MNPYRRAALIEAAAIARKRHAPVAHIDHELTWATVEQLKLEMTEDHGYFWPTPIVVAALFIGIACIAFAMSGV